MTSGVAATGSPATAASAERRRLRRRARWRRRGTVLAFLSPWIVGFLIFFGYPIVYTAYLSFTHYDLLSPPRWIGLANYRYFLEDDARVWPSIKNTAYIIGVGVPLQVLFAFGIALLLGARPHGERAVPRASSTCPRWCRRSPRRSASSTC